MSLWWLTASSAELRAAHTCRVCGCGDADIDCGLCVDCFYDERGRGQDQEWSAEDIEAYYSLCYDGMYEEWKLDVAEDGRWADDGGRDEVMQ